MREQATKAVIEELLAEREQFLGFVQRRLNDRAAAEDLLQTVYLRALAQVEGLRDLAAGRAWFYRMLRNAIIDDYRRRAVETRVVEPMAEGFDAAAIPVIQPNLCRCMDRAVDAMKPEYADALRGIDLTEGGVDRYAQGAGITTGNAAVRVFRARKALAKSLQQICGSCAGAGCLDCSCAQPTQP
ncbi:MAG: sigma-70 family RNA polymerase sigma factor [Edaphobacter sp.]|uniref:sigma-70 family RNA polymerase sigma factor n=1 Tax=Edaphobacter sp. TaxID=1934404 RepID=UPI00238F5782|nr:sigma-70 family RNA polymerase sigma factor [Edaphobacter sp.]MDE1175459.1 sigma-70 family RNA polymerase sigma factor [Edaphobacter sp.]